MKKLIHSLFVTLMIASMLVAFAPLPELAIEPDVRVEDAQDDDDPDVYYEVNALINLPYFIDHRLGLEFAGYVFDEEVKYVGPVDYDMTQMINAFEQAIAEAPAGINVVGFDPALKPSINAYRSGNPCDDLRR